MLQAPVSVELQAVGGVPPYRWAVAPTSTLPAGFHLSSDGQLSGVASLLGRFAFAVIVTDAGVQSAAATLELVVANVVTNDACSTAAEVVLSTGEAMLVGTLLGARPDGASEACGGSAQVADIYYSFDVAGTSNVEFSVSAPHFAAIFPESCSAALACSTSTRQALSPGRYILAVAGPENDFQVNLKVTAFTSDSCDDAFVIDLSSGTAKVAGSFAGAASDFTSNCGAGADRVYSFELTSAADLVIADDAPTTSHTIKSVRKGPCASSSEIACSTDARYVIRNLQPGPYQLVLAPGSTSMQYSVSLSLYSPTLPPANDDCASATPAVFVHDVATLSGTLLLAGYEMAPWCGDAYADVYFSIDLMSPSNLEIWKGTANLRVQLLSGTCGNPVELACDYNEGRTCSSGLPPGRYYVRVATDSENGAGPFTVVVDRKDVPTSPPNQSCATALPIALASGKAQVRGLLALAGDGFTPSCTGSVPEALHDVVYSLSLTERSDVVLSLDSFWPFFEQYSVVFLSGDCQAPIELGCNDGYSRSPLHLFSIPTGDYWVVVQGGMREPNDCWEGAFALAVTATPSPPPPPNDNCGAPAVLSFAGPGSTAYISGTTLGAANDYSAVSCFPLAPLPGADVVYAFDVISPAALRVSSDTIGLRFFLTAACGSSAAIACSTGSEPAILTTNQLPVGRYYLVVDTTGPSSDFLLAAQTQ
jgi:hypothetical protein